MILTLEEKDLQSFALPLSYVNCHRQNATNTKYVDKNFQTGFLIQTSSPQGLSLLLAFCHPYQKENLKH